MLLIAHRPLSVPWFLFAGLILWGTVAGCTPSAPTSASPQGTDQPRTPVADAGGSTPANPAKPETGAKEDAPAESPPAAEPQPAVSVELKGATWADVEALVASHVGKVVVVDLWSTSCEPCLREFPHLVALQQRHPRDVVCVSFDCDFIGARNKPVDYYRERVLKFLDSQKATTIINLMSTVAADELFQKLDVDSIPAVYVFDAAGKLAKRFDNRTPASETEEGISYELQIDPLVKSLVTQAGSQ